MAIYSKHFQHKLIRKYTTTMGYLLNDIDVVKENENGTENFRIKVPLTYSGKEKFVRRLLEDPELTRQPAITLPMMAFELIGMNYSGERKLSSKGRYVFIDPEKNNTKSFVYTPVPYDFVYNVYITTKTHDEMHQIIEQIAPFFTPDYTFSMVGLKNQDFTFDVPITLDSIQTNDQYEGSFESRRVIMWSLSFLLKGYLFSPVREGKIIKQVNIDIVDLDDFDKQFANQRILSEVDVVPYIDGVALEDIGALDDYDVQVTISGSD